MYPQHFYVCAHVVILSVSALHVSATCRLSVHYTSVFCCCNMSPQHDPSCLSTLRLLLRGQNSAACCMKFIWFEFLVHEAGKKKVTPIFNATSCVVLCKLSALQNRNEEMKTRYSLFQAPFSSLLFSQFHVHRLRSTKLL